MQVPAGDSAAAKQKTATHKHLPAVPGNVEACTHPGIPHPCALSFKMPWNPISATNSITANPN
jgi:hypothetical protein